MVKGEGKEDALSLSLNSNSTLLFLFLSVFCRRQGSSRSS